MAATIDDVELVHAARAGDAAALGALLERHRPGLYAAALAMLRDRDLARDVVHDTFVIALQRIDTLRDPAAVGAWLHTITRNACRMQLRRATEELPGELRGDSDGISDAEQALDQLALRDWVWTALEQLPQDLRVTVMLRHFTARREYTQIASTLGIPVGTVRSRLNQARLRLADALLQTAATTHLDHATLVQQRREDWDAFVDEIYSTGTAKHYAASCADDVLVEAPSMAYRQRGIDDHRRGVEESAAAGVQLHLTGVVASPGVTIFEGTYENPPGDPHHCPATHTEVRLHPDGKTTRIVLHYPATTTGPGRP